MYLPLLFDVMDKLNAVHQELLQLAGEKRQVIVRNEIDQLMQIVAKESKLLKQVTELDRQRIDAIGKYMLEKGFRPNPNVTVSDLMKIIFKAEEKKPLQEAHDQLLQTINELRAINALNQTLIEQSLAFIQYSMDLVLGPDEEAVYHNPQQQNTYGKRNGIFDTRA
ncbi:flagellar protein FlgN [Paenibacillus hamazuiensis]|uniref:flagellar protein FlgN n=1 Tax=Paenibacillus hamazuiensis TaxID=2936508 RepID=UPI00200DD322|nr:flagellar protein FlgN [Paenibacillus hamazuiensis]